MSNQRLRSTLIGCGLILAGALLGCPPAQPPTDNDNGDSNEPAAEVPFHETVFTTILPAGYEGPASCQVCHLNLAQDLAQSGHWSWAGTSSNIVEDPAGTNGKRNLINAFLIGVPSNEGRCAQCHPSYDWTDKTFDFTSTASVDCFICHDSTGTYAKAPTAGGPAALVSNGELTPASPAQLQNVAYNVALPKRQNCGACHFYADGGDNVMHGDMPSDLAAPSRELDVHMGGLDFSCQTCHQQQKHGIAGFQLHSVDEGGQLPVCTRCHGETDVHTANPPIDQLLNLHLERVACETCHIPTLARSRPTRVAWFWDTAGQDTDPNSPEQFGLPGHDKLTGSFVWNQEIRPTYRWFNGNWQRMIVGVSDTYANAGTLADPVVLAEPVASKDSTGAKIYPFKRMLGRQPADTTNKRLVVPHLFGTAAGPNPFWEKFDWTLALQEGAAYSGVAFSGEFGFPNTVTYLSVNHQVAPKEMALNCNACHGVPPFWAALGLTDPLPGPQ